MAGPFRRSLVEASPAVGALDVVRVTGGREGRQVLEADPRRLRRRQLLCVPKRLRAGGRGKERNRPLSKETSIPQKKWNHPPPTQHSLDFYVVPQTPTGEGLRVRKPLRASGDELKG